jgi:hypothetical protein
VRNWEEYQSADKLAEIRAKDRERKRIKRAQERGELPTPTGESKTVHGQSTDSPHIEEERDEEKDLEEDFYSFNRSNAREDEDNEIDLSSPEKRREYLGGIGKNVVLLSDEEIGDLLTKISLAEFNYYVGIIAQSELKGHHYTKRTHYQAILDMAYKDRKRISKR